MTGGHHFWTVILSGTDMGKCECVSEERRTGERWMQSKGSGMGGGGQAKSQVKK